VDLKEFKKPSQKRGFIQIGAETHERFLKFCDENKVFVGRLANRILNDFLNTGPGGNRNTQAARERCCKVGCDAERTHEIRLCQRHWDSFNGKVTDEAALEQILKVCGSVDMYDRDDLACTMDHIEKIAKKAANRRKEEGD